jgi:Fe-Mn family superoxide dismutase
VSLISGNCSLSPNSIVVNIRTRLSGAIGSIRNKHNLPDLPYDYNALEPVISAEIMQLHHAKHHQAYVNNLNVAEEKLSEAIARNDTKAIISLQPAIRFNGGGHVNHSIFWRNLSPDGGDGSLEDEKLAAVISKSFGSLENMKTAVSNAAVAVQGSGWGWLAYDKRSKLLQAVSCPNQDPLEPTTGMLLS